MLVQMSAQVQSKSWHEAVQRNKPLLAEELAESSLNSVPHSQADSGHDCLSVT